MLPSSNKYRKCRDVSVRPVEISCNFGGPPTNLYNIFNNHRKFRGVNVRVVNVRPMEFLVI